MPPVSKDPILTVRGEATLDCEPDLASLWWSARTRTDTAEQAESAVAKHLAMAETLLAEHADAIQRIERRVHVSPQFGEDNTQAIGYLGECSAQIDLHDFTQLTDLISGLLQIPDAAVSGPNWSLQPNNPVFTSARLAAIQDARRRAHDYAAAFGVKPTAVLEVIDEPAPAPGFRMAMRTAAFDGGAPALELQPVPQVVTASVTVRFGMGTPDSTALDRPD